MSTYNDMALSLPDHILIPSLIPALALVLANSPFEPFTARRHDGRVGKGCKTDTNKQKLRYGVIIL